MPPSSPSVRPDGKTPSGTVKKDDTKPGASVRPNTDDAIPTGPSGKPVNPKSVGGKTYDDAAAAAAARAKSKENFQKAQTAKAEYTDPKGKVVKIDSAAPKLQLYEINLMPTAIEPDQLVSSITTIITTAPDTATTVVNPTCTSAAATFPCSGTSCWTSRSNVERRGSTTINMSWIRPYTKSLLPKTQPCVLKSRK